MGTLGTQMQPFFDWLVRSTVQAGVIVCLILLIRAVFRNKLGVRWHHALWLILVLRMVLPWAPQSRLSVFNVVAWWDQPHGSHSSLMEPSDRLSATSNTESSTNQPAGSSAATSADGQPKNIDRVPRGALNLDGAAMHPAHRVRDVLPFVWLAGAMALGTYVVVSNARLWRATSIEHPSTDKDVLELLEECRARMGLRTIVALVTSAKANTPVLLGFIRPRLLIPRDIAKQLGQEELRYVFLHELAHVKRHDIALAWLTALLQVLHWFNPLIWLAFHRMRVDRELACDALVLTRTQGEGTKDYGRAIVSLLERFSFPPPLPGLAGILENKSQLKRRIAMITQFKNNSYRWSPLAVALIAILCCISLPDARSGKGAQLSTAEPTGASVSGGKPAATLAGDNNVFVDPRTGIKFTKYKAFSGPSDVIDGNVFNLSPNGKYLLCHVRVVPLDGSAFFDLVNIPNALSGSWSPDGKKVIFYAGAMWLIDVDPETGRPVGSTRKLLDGEYRAQGGVRWSSDSKTVVFLRRDGQIRDEIWTLSIETGELSQPTDPFRFGLVSPDGKMVACSDNYGVLYRNSLLVKPVAGGEARKIADGVRPLVWSADSEWLVCKPMIYGGLWADQIRFVRVADGREVEVTLPGCFVQQSPSPQGKKLLAYHGSTDYRNMLSVISVAGGPPAQVGWPDMLFGEDPGDEFWTPESSKIIVEGKRRGEEWNLWALPLAGKDPQSLTIDAPLCRTADFRVFSPDGTRLLLGVEGKDKTYDLWMVPISLAQMLSTGPAVKIFGGMVPPSGPYWYLPDVWSPDGKRVAFSHQGDIWVASADGQSSVQLTDTSEQDTWPDWSPDGKTIAFRTKQSQTHTLFRVVPASGGEAKTVTELRRPLFAYGWPRISTWSPDGKKLTIASDDVISDFPISGGTATTVLRPKDMGIDNVTCLKWSPDGHRLAFLGGLLRLYVYRTDDAKVELVDNDGVERPWYWSPDSKWICYFSMQDVKTRPEGILWEMDVEEALAKLAK